jgi:hypothetical protein
MAVDSDFLAQIGAYISGVRAKAADGLSIAELAEATVGGMRLAMGLLDRVSMPGVEKKAEVLKLVAFFFDTFADACVPLLARPAWWLVKPAVRALVLSLASGAVESLLPLVRLAA